MMRLKILVLALATLFVVLSVTLNNWAAKVGVSPDQGLIGIFVAEAVVLAVLVAAIRRRRMA